jgi:ABC-type nickel/cobalt efflux system permease component RcnA
MAIIRNRYWLPLLALAVFAPGARAHLVPRENHDRTIVVGLSWDDKAGQFVVQVAYRLEVDELKILNDDLQPFLEQIDLTKYRRKRLELYAEYARLFSPYVADNLDARANGKPLTFKCSRHAPSVTDEKGQELGHVRFDFVFRATFAEKPGQAQTLEFKEGNYALAPGKIDLSLAGDPSVTITARTEPDAALKAREELKRLPGDEDRLRLVRANFNRSGAAAAPAAQIPAAAPAEPSGLMRLLQDSDQYYPWLLMLLAAGFGAIHALTPGHGKTLVAAYLVGERGTTLHALVLGLTTTLTHTGVVLLLAFGLQLANLETQKLVASGLGLLTGLVVAGLGCWLLLRRLAGQADHVHIGGGHHHHQGGHHHHHAHTHADHNHDEHGNVIPRSPYEPSPGWWGVIVMGMSGGIVPCWDAILILVFAVRVGALWLALPMLLAFSAGLASVLVLVGVLVVNVRGFAVSRWGEGGLTRLLPIASAAVVMALGLWLCYDSVHAQPASSPAAARAAASLP